MRARCDSFEFQQSTHEKSTKKSTDSGNDTEFRDYLHLTISFFLKNILPLISNLMKDIRKWENFFKKLQN